MGSRREFLGKTARSLAWLGLAGSWPLSGLWRAASAAPRGERGDAGDTVITLLHTNDVHSRIDPFPEGQGSLGGRGGAARRATLIQEIRAQSPHVLLVDAGDAFQGTPYFNLFRGEVDFRVMSALGYEAMALGNHEFDLGIAGLVAAHKFARFPLLNANYDCSRTALREIVQPHMIRTCGDARVGLFGLGVTLAGLVAEPLCRGVEYSDPLSAAQRAVTRLRDVEQCDLVVCLSHLGNEGYHGEPGDQQLARRIAGIDLIVGGHSHTFMKEPTRVRHGERETLVFQVGWGGIALGRVDFHLRAGRVQHASAAVLPVSSAGVAAEFEEAAAAAGARA